MNTMTNYNFLMGPRIILPVVILLFIIMYIKWDSKLALNTALVFLSIFILFLLLYPVNDFRYYLDAQSNNISNNQMHSFLQLKPIGLNEDKLIDAENDFKIFCLGGSTTNYKDSNNVGWPQRIENKLRSRVDNNISVFNLGVPWYTTLHTLINYEVNLRHNKPDLLIVMHSVNDLFQNTDFSYLSREGFREDYGHYFGPLSNVINQTGHFGYYWNMISNLWYHNPRKIIDEFNFPGIVSFERNLNTLIDLAEQDSVQVLILSQPNIYSDSMSNSVKNSLHMLNMEAIGKDKKWSYKTANRGFKIYSNKIKEICEDRDVLFSRFGSKNS